MTNPGGPHGFRRALAYWIFGTAAVLAALSILRTPAVCRMAVVLTGCPRLDSHAPVVFPNLER